MEDRGLAPMPVLLAVTRADGEVQRLEVPVDVWLGGERHATVRVAGKPPVVRVEIDPDAAYPDVDRRDQVWTADRGVGDAATPVKRPGR
jgi:hypothetical protein